MRTVDDTRHRIPRRLSTLEQQERTSPATRRGLKEHVAAFHRQETRCASVLRVLPLPLPLRSPWRAAAARTRRRPTDPKDLRAELTWWDTSDPKNEGPAFKELIAKFNQTYPNVKINYQSVPFGEAQNKFKTAAAAKSGAPDILRAEVAWVPEFASLGYLYALDGSDLLADESDYFATPLSSNKFNGKTYGVPQVTDSLALLYNKKIFADAGITAAPKTWAEVKTAAADHQGQDRHGRPVHQRRWLLPAAVHLRRGRRPGRHRRARRSSSTPTRTSPASRSRRTSSTAAPRSSRRPTTRTAR